MRMKKAAFLDYWRAIEPGQPVRMSPIRYKHEGSTYGEDSIRITGSQGFVDGILSRLKDLLDNENEDTRLQVTYGTVEPMAGKTPPPMGAIACYVQVHRRGDEARIMAAKLAAYGKHDYAGAAVAQFTIDLEH